MAVLKILGLFLLIGDIGKLVLCQSSKEYYDYVEEITEKTTFKIAADNEFTHVRTKNLSGNVRLTTLQVLTTNTPLDELNNQNEEEDSLESKPSSENKQNAFQTIPENLSQVGLLSELRTKAPTDGTESLILMDVVNRTSGTLPDQSTTEKLITVTQLNFNLIQEDSTTSAIIIYPEKNTEDSPYDDELENFGANLTQSADSENSIERSNRTEVIFIDGISTSMTTGKVEDATLLSTDLEDLPKSVVSDATDINFTSNPFSDREILTEVVTTAADLEISSTFQQSTTHFMHPSERVNSVTDDVFTTTVNSESSMSTQVVTENNTNTEHLETDKKPSGMNLDQSIESVEDLSAFINVDEELLSTLSDKGENVPDSDDIIEDVSLIMRNNYEDDADMGKYEKAHSMTSAIKDIFAKAENRKIDQLKDELTSKNYDSHYTEDSSISSVLVEDVSNEQITTTEQVFDKPFVEKKFQRSEHHKGSEANNEEPTTKNPETSTYVFQDYTETTTHRTWRTIQTKKSRKFLSLNEYVRNFRNRFKNIEKNSESFPNNEPVAKSGLNSTTPPTNTAQMENFTTIINRIDKNSVGFTELEKETLKSILQGLDGIHDKLDKLFLGLYRSPDERQYEVTKIMETLLQTLEDKKRSKLVEESATQKNSRLDSEITSFTYQDFQACCVEHHDGDTATRKSQESFMLEKDNKYMSKLDQKTENTQENLDEEDLHENLDKNPGVVQDYEPVTVSPNTQKFAGRLPIPESRLCDYDFTIHNSKFKNFSEIIHRRLNRKRIFNDSKDTFLRTLSRKLLRSQEIKLEKKSQKFHGTSEESDSHSSEIDKIMEQWFYLELFRRKRLLSGTQASFTGKKKIDDESGATHMTTPSSEETSENRFEATTIQPFEDKIKSYILSNFDDDLSATTTKLTESKIDEEITTIISATSTDLTTRNGDFKETPFVTPEAETYLTTTDLSTTELLENNENHSTLFENVHSVGTITSTLVNKNVSNINQHFKQDDSITTEKPSDDISTIVNPRIPNFIRTEDPTILKETIFDTTVIKNFEQRKDLATTTEETGDDISRVVASTEYFSIFPNFTQTEGSITIFTDLRENIFDTTVTKAVEQHNNATTSTDEVTEIISTLDDSRKYFSVLPDFTRTEGATTIFTDFQETSFDKTVSKDFEETTRSKETYLENYFQTYGGPSSSVATSTEFGQIDGARVTDKDGHEDFIDLSLIENIDLIQEFTTSGISTFGDIFPTALTDNKFENTNNIKTVTEEIQADTDFGMTTEDISTIVSRTEAGEETTEITTVKSSSEDESQQDLLTVFAGGLNNFMTALFGYDETNKMKLTNSENNDKTSKNNEDNIMSQATELEISAENTEDVSTKIVDNSSIIKESSKQEPDYFSTEKFNGEDNFIIPNMERDINISEKNLEEKITHNLSDKLKTGTMKFSSKADSLVNSLHEDVQDFDSTTTMLSGGETKSEDGKQPELLASLDGRNLHFSVRITYNETSFFIPSDAVITVPSSHTLNITWKSSSADKNNSLEINLGHSVQLNIVKGSQIHIYKTALFSEPENKLDVDTKVIALADGIRIYFSNIEVLKTDQGDRTALRADALPSTPKQTEVLAAEIIGGCIGVSVVVGILVYFAIKKFKTTNFIPDSVSESV